jgi:hypothetical protein
MSSDVRSATQLDELIVETRLLIETNRVLRERLRARWCRAGTRCCTSSI